MIAVPLEGDGAPLGTLSVVSRQPAAYDDADAEVLTAFATQASVAIRNARLMEELARQRAVIERRAEAEQALREIATRITAIRQPGDLLQRIVEEARRLLRADGAVIDEFDPHEGVLVSAYDAGLTDEQRESVRATRLHLGEGLSGRAMVERRVIAAGDYLAGEFQHMRETDVMAAQTGIGDLIVAPIIGDEGPLGAIEVYRRDRHAFDDIDAAVLGGLADQAAIAITNARLIEELERSQASVARRADTERALRDITARIAALREPEVILERVVDEAMRLLGTDGAHLTRMGEDGTYLVPVVVAGATDPEMQAWLLGLRFPMGGGINGLAAELGEPVWTRDYIADPRIPHDGNDDEVADRMGLRAMAAAPLRAPGGEVIGTLAISSATPREFEPEERDLLQGLADQAAIAITNSTLLTRLTESEDRYRTLASSSPDMVFATDAEGRYTFLSDQASALLGWDIETSIGRHFMEFVAPGWEPEAAASYAALVAEPDIVHTARIDFRGGNGTSIPLEINVVGSMRDGALSAIHGVARDVSERERLERELHESGRALPTARPDQPGRHLPLRRRGPVHVHGRGLGGTLRLRPGRRPRDELRRLHRRGITRRGDGQLRATEDRARRRPALPLHGQVPRRHDVPGRDHLGLGLGGRPLRRRPGHGPRRHHGRTPRTGAARVAGALPVPRRELAGRRLLDRCRGPLHVHVRIDGADDRLEARGAHRPPLLDGRRARQPPRGRGPLGGDRGRSDDRAGRPRQSPGTRRPAGPGGDQRRRHGRRGRSPSRASTARRATSASGPASNASCASPRSATATSSPRPPTWSG